MSLYKLFSKNPYYFWAVMSIVMQVQVIAVPIIIYYILRLLKTIKSMLKKWQISCNVSKQHGLSFLILKSGP